MTDTDEFDPYPGRPPDEHPNASGCLMLLAMVGLGALAFAGVIALFVT